ncbi:FAD binding domain-containing protein [Mycena capillaripes]|nr:FAD binding domain-containing protein [Mycena capillaripes]
MATPSVIIAGAGPSGLILAIILRKSGVSVRIIDKETTHRVGSRGSTIQPRTLELYDILGVLPDILKIGATLPSIAKYDHGEIRPTSMVKLADILEPTPDIPHPNAINVSQDLHEEILRNHLRMLGCSVELGSELRSFEQFPDHVVAHIVTIDSEGKQKEESTRYDWLVGTDGAHSVVRKQLGLSFLGETRTEDHIALGDITVEEGAEPGFWHMWTIPPKMMVLRSSSSTSKVFMFAYSGRPEHLADKTLTRDEFIEEFYAMTGRRDIKFGLATWMTNYRPNMRMVDKMRDGRVFIAGDAAHCHSPTGGQGLNSSVQDSANLGWKLALAAKGLASPTLLDTYSAERLRVIAQMLKLTTELYNQSFDALRAGAEADDKVWSRGGDLRMLGVNYCGSAIVLEAGAVPGGASTDSPYSQAHVDGARVQAGYRAPDASGLVCVRSGSGSDTDTSKMTSLFAVFSAAMHTVLLFGHGDEANVAEVLAGLPKDAVRAVEVLAPGQRTAGSVLVLEDQAGHAYAGYGMNANEPTVVVVRPDGVVGAVVSSVEGVEQYFKKIFL